MTTKTTQTIVGSVLAVAAFASIAFARSGGGEQATTTQDSRPMTLLRTGTSITADDKYLYVLSNGQVARIDKSTGQGQGVLGASGWGGEAPAGGGATTGATTGAATTGSTGGHRH